MSTTTCTKPMPHGIDLTAPGGVAALLEFHRATFGDAVMRAQPGAPAPAPTTPVVQVAAEPQPSTPAAPPASSTTPTAPTERPDGVSETEWASLGDPGKAALARERAARSAAEQELARLRAPKPGQPGTPTAPQPAPQTPATPTTPQSKDGDGDDVASIVERTVQRALAPLLQRDADTAARAVVDGVVQAASERFWDASDALAQVDLTTLTDGTGQPDPSKITAALDALLIRKPHLGKPVDTSRRVLPGSGIGAGGAAPASPDDLVKASLARMQASTGVRFAADPA